ncbi:MAG: glycoside hydrolase family 97 protein [Chitinophagaceae bacterium]
MICDMKLIAVLLFALPVFLVLPVSAQKVVRLSSPDGNLVFSFRLVNKSPQYSVSFKGHTLISSSALNLSFEENGQFKNDLRVNKPVITEKEEKYELVVGKTKWVDDHYREAFIPLEETVAPFRHINLVARVFNDGMAFRYEIPLQDKWTSYSLTDENTEFALTGNPVVHALLLPNYTSSHENEYTTALLQQVKEDTLMDMPALFEFPGKIYLAITEAALLDYAGMYLTRHHNRLRGVLSPLPGQSALKVKASLPHNSPWRVLLINDRIGALIESNIITSLNEPCKIKDVSWIKPGKTTFPWWNGNVVPDTINAPGNNFVTNQYYIDFCARNKLEYHSVVEYGLHEWYVNDGAGFMPGPHADVTKAVPGLDMKKVCDYAKLKGVGIRVWVHWAALYPKLDSAFAQFERWGISGMMIDFMDRDDQQMVNMQTEMLEKAAAHHLHIQFHGAYKPTGLSRTWPNEFTREGTLNYECNKWSTRISPDHDINFPFTRMLAGATDYHLGGFRAVADSAFVVQYTRPLMRGTRCHMLGMYVVLESYLGMVCDYPEAYEGQPGFEFLKEVPTTWDETKVLGAEVGRYITIARRKNADWFIGSITNHEERSLKVSFNFLPEGKYEAAIYSDAPDANTNPNKLVRQTRVITNKDSVTVQLKKGGGEVMRIRRL